MTHACPPWHPLGQVIQADRVIAVAGKQTHVPAGGREDGAEGTVHRISIEADERRSLYSAFASAEEAFVVSRPFDRIMVEGSGRLLSGMRV